MMRFVFILMLLAIGVLISRAQVTLLWDRNPAHEQVTGYKVGFGPASGSYTAITNVGDVTEARVPSNGQTFYAIRAYNADGLLSAWSSEVVFTPGGSPQFYLGIQPVTLLTTAAPPVLPPSFAPVPGYLVTTEIQSVIGGPVTRYSEFVEEGGNAFFRRKAVATNGVPKYGRFTVVKRSTSSILPPSPVPVQSSKFKVQSSKFLTPKPTKGGGR